MSKKRFRLKDRNGNVIDYDIEGGAITLDDENKTLTEKLAEMEDDIADAAESGSGTPAEGSVTKAMLAQSVQASLDLADSALQSGDLDSINSAITAINNAIDALTGTSDTTTAIDTMNEVIAFLAGLTNSDTLTAKLFELSTAIAAKYTKPDSGIPETDMASAAQTALALARTALQSHQDISGKSDVGHTHTSSDITDLATLLADKLEESDISVTSNQDGTVVIAVGTDTYTINLNHTHDDMLKVSVVNDENDLPSPLNEDTIYGVQEDGELSVVYIGGYPFYGGGGISTPTIRRPVDGSTVSMGDTVGGSVSEVINVKGKSLTMPLTIQLVGTGYTFDNTQPTGVTVDSTTQLTVTAAAANDANGVDITVVYTGSAENASATMSITSASPDNISVEATLIANEVTYETISAIKMTGTQYAILNYSPNPSTKLEMDMQFEENANKNSESAQNGWFGLTADNTVGRFAANFGSLSSQFNQILYWMNQGYISDTWIANYYGYDFYARGTWVYDNNKVTFQGLETPTETKTTTQDGKLILGGSYKTAAQAIVPLNRNNFIVHEVTISEGGVNQLHLVPKLRNNVPGLYDTVNNVFYPSDGTDDFVAIS